MEDEVVDTPVELDGGPELLLNIGNMAHVVMGSRVWRPYTITRVTTQAACLFGEEAMRIVKATAKQLRDDPTIAARFKEQCAPEWYEQHVTPALARGLEHQEECEKEGKPLPYHKAYHRDSPTAVLHKMTIHDPTQIPFDPEIGGPGLLLVFPLHGLLHRRTTDVGDVIVATRFAVAAPSPPVK